MPCFRTFGMKHTPIKENARKTLQAQLKSLPTDKNKRIHTRRELVMSSTDRAADVSTVTVNSSILKGLVFQVVGTRTVLLFRRFDFFSSLPLKMCRCFYSLSSFLALSRSSDTS